MVGENFSDNSNPQRRGAFLNGRALQEGLERKHSKISYKKKNRGVSKKKRETMGVIR